MGIGDAVVVGLFCMVVVFVVLIVLWGVVAGFGWVLRRVDNVLGDDGQGAER